jgi:hypothetical protein
LHPKRRGGWKITCASEVGGFTPLATLIAFLERLLIKYLYLHINKGFCLEIYEYEFWDGANGAGHRDRRSQRSGKI